MRRDRVVPFQRRLNPVMLRLCRYLPGQLALETIGRTSGRPRLTPLGGRRDGTTVWIVSEFGRGSNYVRNIEANPNVRVRIGRTWHTGLASILPDDDARERLRHLPRYNSLVVRAVGSDLLTVQIELSA